MKHKFLLKLVCLIVGIAATCGVLPSWIGLASNVVINELDQVEVTGLDFDPYEAKVMRVIDGDTLEVVMTRVPGDKETLRLIGVDTPETKHPRMPVQFYGPEATQFVKNLCDGREVRLHLQKNGPERGSYGRLLVYVELPDGSCLNEEIIRNGFGYSYSKYPHEKLVEYEALQVEAINAKRGLWASVKFEDLPGWLREARPDILD